MTDGFTPESAAAAIRRYLDSEMTADDLRAYLTACDAAIESGTADRKLSGPVGAAALVLMEMDEGVRPPADVRSTLLAAVRTLAGTPAPRGPAARAPIPKLKARKRSRPPGPRRGRP